MASGLGFQQDLKSKKQRRTKTFYSEDRTTVYEHENEEVTFKVNIFNVALHTLIQNIKSRFETTTKVNNMFSLIWDSSVDSNDAKAKELSQYYPKDLRAALLQQCYKLSMIYTGPRPPISPLQCSHWSVIWQEKSIMTVL